MLARCPDCATVFRVAPADLRAARGLVRCGVCFGVFDAVEVLEDPAQPILPAAVVEALPDPLETTGLDLSDGMDRNPTEAFSAEPKSNSNTKRNSNKVPATRSAAVLGRAGALADPETGTGPVTTPALAAHAMLLASERPRPRARAGWVALTALMTLCLFAQLAWFRGAEVLRAYPGLQKPLAAVCTFAGCQLPGPRDPGAVRVMERDLREHPRYRDALLVNAILVNQAAFAQPYPILELALYDTEGAVVAGRRFEPREYLDRALDADGLMPAGQPLHVVLELVGPKRPSASFELRFL
ncbi:MAG: zinc-ribbon domain-containing protein [Gammaproteobacteria bacterium]|nr:zinc-ribbon domain-containing protein [Gammaproteobacteria bacterium]